MNLQPSLSVLALALCLSACRAQAEVSAPEQSRVPEAEPETARQPAAGATSAAVDADVESEPDSESAKHPFPHEMIEGEPMYTVLGADGIPAIDEPVFVSADEADSFMDMEETVLGVVGVDGTAKCYSAWQLDSHEIVNDVLDGHPIAATW